MTTTTSTRPPARTPWAAHSQPRQRPKPTTTPLALPTRTPASVGQSIAPLVAAKVRSPSQTHDPRSPSPNYFGLIVEAGSNPVDSNAGMHVKSNWSPPSAAIRPVAVPSPINLPLDSNQEFEAFRKQTETHAFSLSHGNLSHFSIGSSSGRLPTLGSLASMSEDPQRTEVNPSKPTSPKTVPNRPQRRNSKDVEITPISRTVEQKVHPASTPSLFDLPYSESPLKVPLTDEPRSQRSHLHVNERHPRLSLPGNRIDSPSPSASEHHLKRAETLPSCLNPEGPVMITPQSLVDLLKNCPQEVLLLDLRVSPQYMQSRIKGALNLCIPTTLLKRPSFNIQKLAETFTEEKQKAKFADWKQSKYIVVYDTNANQLKDAVSCVNTLKKFVNQGWQGECLVIRGGFLDFSRRFPDMVEFRSNSNADGSSRTNLSIDAKMAGAMPVIGGCPMPSAQTAANPFFGNIRQNTDLIAGVGQMPIKHPAALTERGFMELPQWIREAADNRDQGKLIADRFLNIEKAEQARMQKAFSGDVSYGSAALSSSKSVQLAGIEKGTKNRYKDMLPYDHSRVRLQNVPSDGCDYVNASHVKAGWSNRHYIASQAPVPATFEDFWRVVWEQDARVIVMLTAESEGGQRKSHPYWLPNDYGPLKLKSLSEKRISLEPPSKLSPGKLTSPLERPGVGRRRATNPLGAALKDATPLADIEVPYVTMRKLTLSHANHPFQPLREITQLQYSSWPDFGTPAHPAHVLGLVENCAAIIRSYAGSQATDPSSPAQVGERPIVVHCSAGCGRTGTFCTVDSVVDMLKRQRNARRVRSDEDMEVDEEEWVSRDDVDLIAKTVEDFRLQRLSMVQTLRQFVLCYESVLEWLVGEMPERVKKEGLRRSYQG